MQAQDPSVTTLVGPVLLLLPLAVILFFVQLTAAMETALGSPPRSWFTFHLDKPMWRLLGGFLAALLAIIVLMIGYAPGLLRPGLAGEGDVENPGIQRRGAPDRSADRCPSLSWWAMAA